MLNKIMDTTSNSLSVLLLTVRITIGNISEIKVVKNLQQKQFDQKKARRMKFVPSSMKLSSNVLKGSGKRLYTTKVPISRGISQKLGEGQSQDKASTFAILDYHEESPRTSSIDIKNPALKKGLTDVLSNYPDVYTEAPVLSTSPPFLPFLHRWDRFLQAEKASSEGTKDLFRILRHHLERGLKEPFRVYEIISEQNTSNLTIC
ncbi:hypothetical protein QL093DRAFT_2087777 [Fusarium oxysporum]|nr:hypothetical protein QL093DRAFT_2087777 [Fusarium oxysporum]